MTSSSKSESSTVYLARVQEIFVLLAGGKMQKKHLWCVPFWGYISELNWGRKREVFYINQNS